MDSVFSFLYGYSKLSCLYIVLHARCTFFLSSSHPRWFQMPQQLPCSAWVLLTTVSMCSNHSWSSGRANKVKKSLWPPASSSAHTQPPLPQTWALSSCANMSRYQTTGNIFILKREKVECWLDVNNCVAPLIRDMPLMCLKPTPSYWLKWCSGCRIKLRRLLTPTHVSHLLSLTTPGSTIYLK